MTFSWVSPSEWRVFEMVAAGRLKRLDPGLKIEQHKRVRGRESGCLREVDILAAGTIAGIPTSLIVECKHLRDPVGIELVDAFIGKLKDIGVSRGILISSSGFTAPGRNRALGSRLPRVQIAHLPFVAAPRIQLRGPFAWRLDSLTVNGCTDEPWVTLPGKEVLELGDISTTADGVLIVENLGVFASVASCREVADRWVCVLGNGLPSGDLIHFLSSFDSVPVASWYDLDADGTRMVNYLSEFSRRPVSTIGMCVNLWREAPKWPQGPEQLRRSRKVAAEVAVKIGGNRQLKELAAAIADSGEGCGQEAVQEQVLRSLPEELHKLKREM